MKYTLRHVLAAAALGVGAASIATSCGVPLDDSPRAIDQSTTSTSSPTTAAPPESGGLSQSVFYLDGDQLVAVEISADETSTIRDALTAVLGAPPAELKTSIPTGTALLGFDLDGSTALIDLSGEMDDIEAERQTQAYAQLVFTALASGEADRVMFLVDGDEVKAPSDNGSLSVVSADDYNPPLNPG